LSKIYRLRATRTNGVEKYYDAYQYQRLSACKH
jgi:hypothetical protein